MQYISHLTQVYISPNARKGATGSFSLQGSQLTSLALAIIYIILLVLLGNNGSIA